jgi:hypothetical protein
LQFVATAHPHLGFGRNHLLLPSCVECVSSSW